MEMGFRVLLMRAKSDDVRAMADVIQMYRPLVIKLSIVGGTLDEDLFQELMATLVKCIFRIQLY